MCSWKEIEVANLGRIVTGKTPKTAEKDNYDGDVMFVTPSDNMDDKYIVSTGKRLTEKGKNSVKGSVIPAGSVCVSCIGSDLGKVVITTEECVTNQQINSIVVDTDKYDIDFVYYSMLVLGKELNYHSKTSTAVPIVNKSSFSSYLIRCPSIEIQKQISSVLSSIDQIIINNKKINQNLQAQARALYNAWFIDCVPFGGIRPDNWKTGKLKDVLTLKRNSIKAGENTELPYLPIDVIPMNTFALSDVKPNEEAQSSLITFDKDDIVIGAMRVYFHRVIIAPFAGITRTTCFTLKPSDSDYLCFGLLCCDQDSSIEYAQKTSKGSTMPYAVWDGGLGDMDIVIPDKDTAHEFNEVVLPMIRIIQSSYDEIKHLSDLRDSLLPRLMSGEIDVSAIEL